MASMNHKTAKKQLGLFAAPERHVQAMHCYPPDPEVRGEVVAILAQMAQAALTLRDTQHTPAKERIRDEC